MEIRLQGVDFRYGGDGFRLRVPEWQLEAGGRAVFTGASGSGKTTLLRLLAGILLADEGKVELDGEDFGGLGDGERRAFRIRNVGFVFQDFRLVEYLDVRENLLLPFRINRALPMERAEKLESLAEGLGIAGLLDRHPGDLSQGERQRVAIGRALLPGPRLILADEPTGNLDPDNSGKIMDLLLKQAAAATVVMVTHDHSLVERFDVVKDFGEFAA
ncbi:MAG: ABC transporter ATP-binding protein [Verrucomicrobiales bacterium]|nr:ABC transporter ATP-binding protein [Verrucomicrobiales bacterium]|tara:strand:- start:919 stop:1566 length:648 start_codon:yes stop_codon:yes gene_type:complete